MKQSKREFEDSIAELDQKFRDRISSHPLIKANKELEKENERLRKALEEMRSDLLQAKEALGGDS